MSIRVIAVALPKNNDDAADVSENTSDASSDTRSPLHNAHRAMPYTMHPTNLIRGGVTLMRTLVAAAVACLALAGLSHADDTQAAVKKYQIEAQPISTALKAFAAQSDMQLIYTESDVGQAQTTGVSGDLKPRDALTSILKGTDLEFEFTTNNVIVVRKPGSRAIVRTTSLSSSLSTLGGRGEGLRLAQAEGDDNNEGMQKAQDTDSPDSAKAGDESKLEEIIVTAQKRQEKLQDVPISIAVLTGEKLDASTAEGLSETLSRIPGVSTTPSGTGTMLNVRGVSASGQTFSASNAIAFYLDGVPMGSIRSANVPDANIFDLNRVEVMLGPQGTLYGASALNGVVNVVTNEADASSFDIKARASASTTEGGGENYRADAAINVPIVENKLAARMVVGYQDLSGWIDRPNVPAKDTNDSEILTARLKVNLQPTEDLSIGVVGWISRTDLGNPHYALENQTNLSIVEEPQTLDYELYGVNLDYALDTFSITSKTNYSHFIQAAAVDRRVASQPGDRLYTSTTTDSVSEELLLNSTNAGDWRWSLGAMYRQLRDHTYQHRVTRIAPIDFTDRSKSYAAFGEVTRLFMDGKLELTAGLRYFEDDVKLKENQKIDAVVSAPRPLFERHSKFDALTPRVVLAAHPAENFTVYASYAEGFRSGQDQNPISLVSVPTLGPVTADTLHNYELGAKSTLLDGRVLLGGAVYFLDWEDIQQVLVIVQPSGVLSAATTNANSASGIGAEFSLVVQPAEALQFGVSAAWNDLTFDDDTFSLGGILFFEGERPSYSPEYTAAAFTEYTIGLRNGYSAQLQLSANYTSELETRGVLPGPGGPVVQVGDPMLIGRASLAIESSKQWRASIFVDNLTNEDGAVLKGLEPNLDQSTRTRPRTIGAQLEYRF